jgi:hypothetical protein
VNFLDIYQRLPGLVLGFHGCDAEVGEALLADSTAHLQPSTNDYDWLGGGIYFWENDPQRALEFATQASTSTRISKGKITKPFVIGSVIDLGLCCNLLDRKALDELRQSYEILDSLNKSIGATLPKNGTNRLTRYLDCLVIENVHKSRTSGGLASYDTVRGAIWEGGPLYPGANIETKNHVQIAVRNVGCIKGYFRPRCANSPK